MRKPKLSIFSVVQLIITVAAIMFGMYGFMLNSNAPGNPHVAANAGDNTASADTGEAPGPLEIPDKPTQPAGATHKPEPVGPIETVASDPDDHGNATLKGSVKFSDGSAIDGLRVTAISTQANLPTVNWDTADPKKTHALYDHYFHELERNTRVVTSDATGHFVFSGLDSKHSYSITINDPEIGQATRTASPGTLVDFQFDLPVMIDGAIVCDGDLPSNFMVTVNADNGQGSFQYFNYASFDDGDGKFRIRGKLGKVQLVVTAKGFIQDKMATLELTPDGATCEIKMVRGASLSGRVTSSDGSPMQSVTVTVAGAGAGMGDQQRGLRAWGNRGGDSDGKRSAELEAEELVRLEDAEKKLARQIRTPSPDGGPGGNSSVSGYSDADGHYRIEGVRPGTWTVTASYGTITTSRDITIKGGENFADFELATGNRVKITARDTAGNALTVSYAWFVDAAGNYVQANQLPVTKQGELEYVGVKEGECKLTAQANGYSETTTNVDVRPGMNTFEVVFQEPATLTGKISVSGGKIPQNLYVRLTPQGENGNSDLESDKSYYNGGQYYNVDAEGNYVATPLQPGEYTFSVEFSENDVLYKTTLTIVAGKQTQDATIDERCALTVNVELAPEVKSGEGITIMISKPGDGSGEGFVGRYGQLDENNRCEFSFLPEGEYSVMAYSQDGQQSNTTVSVRLGRNSVSLSVGPPNCVQIIEVSAGYQAADAGLKVGDQIVEYNGVAITSYEQLIKEVQATNEEDSLTMVVMRGGTSLSFRLKGGRVGISGTSYRR